MERRSLVDLPGGEMIRPSRSTEHEPSGIAKNAEHLVDQGEAGYSSLPMIHVQSKISVRSQSLPAFIRSAPEAWDAFRRPEGFNDPGPRKNISLRRYVWLIYMIILIMAPLWSPPLLAIILVKIGPSVTQDPTTCTTRAHDFGFEGNKDLYGLGVRLGAYLHWTCSILASWFLPEATLGVATSYLAFQLGILVAFITLIFQRDCTYFAEILVILHIFFGGAAVTTLPAQLEHASKKMRIMEWVLWSTTVTALLITLWFVVRTQFGPGTDFILTPGETFMFNLGPVRRHRWGQTYILWTINLMFQCMKAMNPFCDPSESSKLKTIGHVRQRIAADMATLGLARTILVLLDAPLFVVAAKQKFVDKRGTLLEGRPWKLESWWWPHLVLSLFVPAFAASSIELTLQWNNVSGVHELWSTGQVIPLIVGLTQVASLAWKFWDKMKSRRAITLGT